MIVNSTLIFFGKGDILITPAIGMETGRGKIKFNELEKPVKIGTKIVANLETNDYQNPVELIFEKTESIDALIDALKTCKKSMIRFQKKKGG